MEARDTLAVAVPLRSSSVQAARFADRETKWSRTVTSDRPTFNDATITKAASTDPMPEIAIARAAMSGKPNRPTK